MLLATDNLAGGIGIWRAELPFSGFVSESKRAHSKQFVGPPEKVTCLFCAICKSRSYANKRARLAKESRSAIELTLCYTRVEVPEVQ